MSPTLTWAVRNIKSEEFFLGQRVFFISSNRKAKGGKKRSGPGVIIGRFGGNYALVHFRGSYLEVNLGDMRSTNRLFHLIGCGWDIALACNEYEIPNTLTSGFANSYFPFRNGK